jgi:hypothetical protein
VGFTMVFKEEMETDFSMIMILVLDYIKALLTMTTQPKRQINQKLKTDKSKLGEY